MNTAYAGKVVGSVESIDRLDIVTNYAPTGGDRRHKKREIGVPLIEFDVVDLARKRLAQDKNNLVVFSGETGSGKSMASLDFARKLDPTFCLDDIVFTVPDFLARVKDLKAQGDAAGKVVVFEEVGIGADSRESMSKKNIAFGQILKLFRYLQISVVFNVQNLQMFDVNGRRLIHYHAVMAGIDRRRKRAATHFFIVDSHHSFEGEPRYFFPVLEIKNLHLVYQIDPVWFNLPPVSLTNPYKRKKDEFLDDLVSKMEKQYSRNAKDEERGPFIPIPEGAPLPPPPQRLGGGNAPINF